MRHGFHLWRLLLVAWVILFTGLTAWSFQRGADQRNAIAKLAERTNMSLCTLRGDLKQRVASSEAFLLEHPNGFDGVTATVIRANITNEKHTIDALSNLNCKENR